MCLETEWSEGSARESWRPGLYIDGVQSPVGPKNRKEPGVRARIVATKLGNASGAKAGQESGWVKDRSEEEEPASVSEETKQAGEVRARWAWTEPCIWTPRMLTALERGVQGSKWFSLCDKAFSLRSLSAAFSKVKANGGACGVDGVTIKRFEANLVENLERLHVELMEGNHHPQPVRRVWIPKPGSREKRPLGIPTVRDRVVQAALKAALEPIFEKDFCSSSFGFRPGRSCHRALSAVWKELRNGMAYVVDADMRKFFDTIPHEVILRGLEEKISDGKLLKVVASYLAQGVMDQWSYEPTREGTPQGSVISPLLANIALHGLDLLAREHSMEMVRYADDFVVLCRTGQEAKTALKLVADWIARNGLRLHPEKTRIVDYGNGESFDFLGFTFCKGRFFPRKKSIQNLRDKIRAQTPRSSGKSLQATICALNPILRGWFGYFKASPEWCFRDADGFARRRLRAILDIRAGTPPAHRGFAHFRWPKAFFDRESLYSMASASRARSILSEATH